MAPGGGAIARLDRLLTMATASASLDRAAMLARLEERREPWDLLVIGGGATGAGVALDAAARHYSVALVEQADFGKGASSRSTKLIHGGVRYLKQGNLTLVMDALKERGILRRNAPHLVRELAFVVPSYDWWEAPFYGIGMRIYDLLAGKYGFGGSRSLSREETLALLPTISTGGLRGGVLYYDGQFDDARLLMALVRTAAGEGAVLVNYCEAVALTRDGRGFINGTVCRDQESGREIAVTARAVVNATGPFCDAVRRMEDARVAPMIAPSQGIHLVLDADFLPGESAIMVPRTGDGRVIFAIPWLGRTLLGTTDTPIRSVDLEPEAQEEEIEFLLEAAARYLNRAPTRSDVRSVFAGIRPLVKAGDTKNTAALSRDHTIHISDAGLVTITGGKWTTYRHMAEDCVDHAATLAGLDPRPCRTGTLPIHGHTENPEAGWLGTYGQDAAQLLAAERENPRLAEPIAPTCDYRLSAIQYAVEHEMARTVEDALSRRTRLLQLDAKAAAEAAPRAAALMAAYLKRDAQWRDDQVRQFQKLAQTYRLT